MKGTILAVDDNEAHRYALARTLEAAGYQVKRAATGNEALDIVAREHPDAVLLDVNLPDVNGFEVCLRIKASAVARDIAVIFHSASTMGSAQAHAAECGASAFLTYPIDANHLLSLVEGALARRGTRN